ncbi:hypothetical protein C2U33_24215, partial [Ralstonia solanacearum]
NFGANHTVRWVNSARALTGMARKKITNELWKALEPLLPATVPSSAGLPRSASAVIILAS